MEYVVGVDCGGTKTEARAYSLTGELLESSLSGFGNVVVDFEVGLNHIKEALDGIFCKLSQEYCEEITLGVAGVDSGGLSDKLERALDCYHIPIHLINDGKLAHYSILKGHDGVTITAGTGSVILGLSESEWFRVGGWGHLFGDQGSAYFIAKRGIQQALKEYDLGTMPSDLSLALFDYFQVASVFELTKKVYTLQKAEIASAATVIANLENSSLEAEKIIIEAGNDLAVGVLEIIHKMPCLKFPVHIGLNGSVVEKNKGILKALKKRLDKEKVDYQLIIKEESCAKGAYYLKKRNENK